MCDVCACVFTVCRCLQVAQAMASGQGGDLLSERFRIRITRADIASLSHHAWLNDEVGGVSSEQKLGV